MNIGTSVGTSISHRGRTQNKGKKGSDSEQLAISSTKLIPKNSSEYDIGYVVQTPFDSRANYPSVTKYEQSEKCWGRSGVNSF